MRMAFRAESSALPIRFAGRTKAGGFGRSRPRYGVMEEEVDYDRVTITRRIIDISTSFTHINCKNVARFMTDREMAKITEIIESMEGRGVLVRKISPVRKRNGHQKKTSKSKPPCFICTTRKRLTLHHVMPRALDGPNTKDNLLSLCRKCHDSIERRIAGMEREALESGGMILHIDYVGVILIEKLKPYARFGETNILL